MLSNDTLLNFEDQWLNKFGTIILNSSVELLQIYM